MDRRNTGVMLCAMTALVVAGTLVAGPLDPPAGAIGPTHKTLTEVEPRIAISAANTPGDNDATPSVYKISQPGSYYLTGNITGASGKYVIQVDADDVTIDLNGFSINGVPGGRAGITDRADEKLPPITNLTVRNGTIRACPGGGVSCFHIGAGRLEGLGLRNNGSSGVDWNGVLIAVDCTAAGHANGFGFSNQGSGVMTGCTAVSNGTGFDISETTLENCSASHNVNGFFLYSSIARGCIATGNTASGIGVGVRSSAIDCLVDGGTVGIDVFGPMTRVEGCSVWGSGTNGIRVGAVSCTVLGNTIAHAGAAATDAGIQSLLGVTGVWIERNTLTGCTRGIDVDGTGCVIIGNRVGAGRSVGGSTPYTYSFAAGNRFGPIISAAAGAAVVAAPGAAVAGSVSTADPNANLAY